MVVHSKTLLSALEICADATVPTQYGLFQFIVFRWGAVPDLKYHLSPDHVALVRGDVRGKARVPVRVHSECLTSEVFGSLKCDCKGQLERAQEEVGRSEAGVILYLRQEGRGIGLANKIRAYNLQHYGHDTVDANRLLGLPDDERDYRSAAAMLHHLGVASICLMTNNPLKLEGLRQHGVTIEEQGASVVELNAFSAAYLDVKRRRMGHTLPPPPCEPALDGPADAAVVGGDQV